MLNKTQISYIVFVFSLVLVLVVPINTIFAGGDPLVRIGDLTRIEGIRDNQLIGYGLVVGLAGSGDTTRSQDTLQARVNVLRQFGINVSPNLLSGSSTAAVIVTATLPPFSYSGNKIDVNVSVWGDARSLQGGTLMQTPLQAANGEIYAVAQGPLSIGGFDVTTDFSRVTRNFPTVATIPGGALVEREQEIQLDWKQFILLLENPNFETASRIREKINSHFSGEPARALNAGQIEVTLPEEESDPVSFISRINGLEVEADVPARVIINERTGSIAMTHNVRLSTVSVQKEELSVTINSHLRVEQPPPFTEGETVIIGEEEIFIEEMDIPLQIVERPANIEDLIRALNAIGASSREMIAILQDIKAAGALHAELIIR